jgi:hypothetical protein
MRDVLIDSEFGLLEVEWYQGIPLLHAHVKKWSHTAFKKEILPLWVKALAELKEQGCDAVLAVIPATETKIAKFHALFGMHEAVNDGEYIISRRWL